MKKTLLLIFIFLLSISVNAQTYIGLTGGLAASKTNINEQTEMLFTGASSFKVERVTALYYGGFLSNGLGTKGRINLQAGFNVIQKGYEANAGYYDPTMTAPNLDEKRTYTIQNFEIPLTLRLVLGKPGKAIDPYLIGGGYLGIIRKAHMEYEITTTDPVTNEELSKNQGESDYKPYDENDLAGSGIFMNGLFLSNQKDLGFIYGGGFAFNLGQGGPQLFIEAKSSRSLNNRSVFMDINGNASDPKVGNRTFYLSLGLAVPIFKRMGSGGGQQSGDDNDYIFR